MGGGYVEGVDSDFEVRKFLVCFEYFLFWFCEIRKCNRNYLFLCEIKIN